MQEVAARAGVAMRSVFRHFSDMEGLFAAVDARLRLEALPLLHEPDPTKTRRRRLRGLVRQRTRVFERIASLQARRRRAALAVAVHPERAAAT